MKEALVPVAIILLLLPGIAGANVFNMPPGLASVETVAVGDSHNEPDSRHDAPGYGSVSYEYQIGKYEVTTAQYAEFLNAKAKSDPYCLYSPAMWSEDWGYKIRRKGLPGKYSYTVSPDFANKPINFVSFWNACRFANWLHNGQGNGDTETGAYTLNGQNGLDGGLIQRNPGALWFVPSEDEWYKAAYYKGGGLNSGYWDYPTQSDIQPDNIVSAVDPGNCANYWVHNYCVGPPFYLTDVGLFTNSTSAYGTYDQGGNLWEWNEQTIFEDWSGEFARGQRGGSFADTHISSLFRHRGEMDGWPTAKIYDLGFRVAGIIPQALHASIDIKPGDNRNQINLKSNGILPVAIFSTSGFDALCIDPKTCQLTKAYPVRWMVRDLNRNGRPDLLLHFKTGDLKLTAKDTTARFVGRTLRNETVEGKDKVTIIPRK